MVVFSQNEEAVPDLTASEFNKKVLLTWTLTQGNTCNGIDVFQSIDGINFTKIGDIEGICGSPEASISYNFTHAFPEKNAVNYYRLRLGALGYTYTTSVEVWDLSGDNYILRPNPISDTSELLFSNDGSKEAVIRIFNAHGNLRHTETTITEKFNLSKTLFASGIYYFEIETLKRKILGKFIVD